MKLYLNLLFLSSICIVGCTSTEKDDCKKIESYIISSELGDDWELVLVASDRYCDTCLELALSQIVVKEKRQIKIILSGTNYPKAILDILKQTPINVSVKFDRARKVEKYFSLAKPMLFFLSGVDCQKSVVLTSENVLNIYQ